MASHVQAGSFAFILRPVILQVFHNVSLVNGWIWLDQTALPAVARLFRFLKLLGLLQAKLIRAARSAAELAAFTNYACMRICKALSYQ